MGPASPKLPPGAQFALLSGDPEVRGHGGGGPGSRISSEQGWFLDGSYVVIVLGNYDLPGASALYQKLIGFLAAQ